MTMTERQWSDTVLDLATTLGWKVYRVDNATREIVRSSGARVRVRNVNAGGVGFPDLVLARRGRLIFAELKRGRRTTGGSWKVTPEQQDWMKTLAAVPNVTVVVWTPGDLDAVTLTLAYADVREALGVRDA